MIHNEVGGTLGGHFYALGGGPGSSPNGAWLLLRETKQRGAGQAWACLGQGVQALGCSQAATHSPSGPPPTAQTQVGVERKHEPMILPPEGGSGIG